MAKRKSKDPLPDTPEEFGQYLDSQMPVLGLGQTRTRPFPAAGLRLDTLAERALFGSNVMLFGRVYEFYGYERTCKSAFVADRYRYIVREGGRYNHNDTEDKDASEMRLAVIGPQANIQDQRWSRRARSMEDWMRNAYAYLCWYISVLEQMGRKVPYACGVDSLMGKFSEDTIRGVTEEKGAPPRSFPVEAFKISRWIPTMTDLMYGQPAMMFLVNHDQAEKHPVYPNQMIHKAPGGYRRRFAATCRFLMRSKRDLPRTPEGVEGQRIQIVIDKNSAGRTGTEIEVDFQWRRAPLQEGGPPVLQARWNWAKATTEVIFETASKHSTQGKALRDLMRLRRYPEDRGVSRYSCEAVGIPPSDPQPAETVGDLINQNRELSDQLDQLFEISSYHEFIRGIDLHEQVGWSSDE